MRLLAAILALVPLAAPAQAPECVRDGAQSQLNACAGEDSDAAERELDRTYRAIVERYADQPLFLEKLGQAQQHWSRFRDAELEARYPVPPGEDVKLLYGSMHPMCWAGLKERLTRERIAQLRIWLDGAEKGDGCAGSAPIRQD
jgi:uncharacterized protein YecT (DUF1311 family)